MSEADHDLPLVSVIIRTLDRPTFLARAIASIDRQTHPNIEIIVVNDGGAAAGVDAAVAGTNRPVTVIHNRQVSGRVRAMNTGVERARGEFFAIHDDDDTWDPSFLSVLISRYYALRESEGLDLVGMVSRLVRITETDSESGMREISRQVPEAENRAYGLINMLHYISVREDFYPIQLLVRRDVMETIGAFDEAYNLLEDREFFVRMLAVGEIGVVDAPLAFHHVRERGAPGPEMNSIASSERYAIYFAKLDNELLRNGFSLPHRKDSGSALRGIMITSGLARAAHETHRRVDELGRMVADTNHHVTRMRRRGFLRFLARQYKSVRHAIRLRFEPARDGSSGLL